MKKAFVGMGALLVLASMGTGCASKKQFDEAVSRANAGATRAEAAARQAEAGVSRAEAACANCKGGGGMRK